jgi:hypothetical protein
VGPLLFHENITFYLEILAIIGFYCVRFCVRFLSFLSSSSEMGAALDKPSEMMAFSLSISELG